MLALGLTGAGSADAQAIYYGPRVYDPGPRVYDPALPPYEIMRIVRSAGLAPLTRPTRRGSYYVVIAGTRSGGHMRVLVDAYAGEVPMLFVAAVPGKQVQLDELKSFIETRISERPALPKAIEILPEMPTTLVGKIFKPRLREIAAEREAEAIAARAAPQASITIKAATDPARGLVLKVNVSGTDHSAVTALQSALAQLPLTSEVIHEH